jgi:hypothetical protein
MAPKFQLLATPWWVNLLLLVPVVCFFLWRRGGLRIRGLQLLYAAVFAVAFGFVEGAAVIYLQAAAGLLPGYHGTLADIIRQSPSLSSQAQMQLLADFPPSLLSVEVLRESATILMLASVALLAAPGRRERYAAFLWVFAFWDLAYYAGLWLTIRWPQSLLSPDILFLIPVPWIAQVWFPVLVSGLSIAVVALASASTRD